MQCISILPRAIPSVVMLIILHTNLESPWSYNNYILLIIIILYTYIYIQYKTDIKMKERAAQGQRQMGA